MSKDFPRGGDHVEVLQAEPQDLRRRFAVTPAPPKAPQHSPIRGGRREHSVPLAGHQALDGGGQQQIFESE
jgi:hypothetical protein